MKNDEHAFRFAGEVDNFRVADNPPVAGDSDLAEDRRSRFVLPGCPACMKPLRNRVKLYD